MSGSTRPSTDGGPGYDYQVLHGAEFGATNAWPPKFADPPYHNDPGPYRHYLAGSDHTGGGSQSGSSESGRRGGGGVSYGQARKPVGKSGIERSDFRNVVDKRSDGIRKGLTKALTLGLLKKKKEADMPDRAPSSATIRPRYYYELPAVSAQRPLSGTRETDYQSITSPPPSVKLPPTPTSTAPPIKRWVGAGRPVQKWNKLRKDPELWDPNGDVLVYFSRRDQSPCSNASLRLSSHIIEATGSPFLITLLRRGSTEDDYAQVELPPSPVETPRKMRHNGYLQPGPHSQPRTISEEGSTYDDVDGDQISYEMYFPVPSDLTKAEARRYAITTRNLFALLYHASIVGLSLFQALQDLLSRLETYMEPTADNVGTIVRYLATRGLDDARNDAEMAVSMLAWSETPKVLWEEGWREAFLHCAGMYHRLESCADFRHLTPITRALLERASLETQLRVQAAEERLVTFAYADVWATAANSAGKAAADRLQQFLVAHYAKICGGAWPPAESSAAGGKSGTGTGTTDGEDTWLTRTLAQTLQRDFGALYDYLVNRDIIWDESEKRSTRKWMMVSESGDKSFDADTDDLPLTDLLIEFDNRLRFPHIPHPYPLVPDSITPLSLHTSSSSAREKPKRDKNAAKSSSALDDRTLERRVQLAYTEATNIYHLGSDYVPSDLVEGFVRFEKTDRPGTVDPACARRGRWVLVYAILQTLASVSVDCPDARYRDGVTYHLSPRLKGTRTPPWKMHAHAHAAATAATEASHELSHCWVIQQTWHLATAATDSAESDASATSAATAASDTDPVLRMMRGRVHHRFPRPPPSTASTSTVMGRSNRFAGGQTSSSLSVRSGQTATPTMWEGGGSSVASMNHELDDTAAMGGGGGGRLLSAQRHIKGLSRIPSTRSRGGDDSARSERSDITTPRAGVSPKSNFRHPHGHNNHGNNGNGNNKSKSKNNSNGNGGSSHHTFGLYPTIPPTRNESPRRPARAHSAHRSPPPAPLDLSVGVTGKGNFFSDVSYTRGSSENGDGKGLLPPRSPSSSSSPLTPDLLLGPLIRDFDELDSVAEEENAQEMTT